MKTIHTFFIVLFSGMLSSCFQSNENTNTVSNMKKIERDNAVINYNISGRGDTTLFFVHGSYIDQTYWKEQVAFFSQKYLVVTMDLPGHGKSGKNRGHWSVQGFAEDVMTVINELALQNVILIGHSLAGDINLIAAASYPAPLIGFISIDYFKNAATPLTPAFQQQVETILQNLKTDFSKTNEQYVRTALITPGTPAEIANRVTRDYRNAYQPMGTATMPEFFRMYETEQELLPQLKLKLYLINVDYLPTNEEPLKKYALNGYEVIHLGGTSHFPMLENPDKLNEALTLAIEKISMDNISAQLEFQHK